MKKSKIYTKAGDSGFSSLFTGEVLEKSNPFFECLGTVDELNSSLGLCSVACVHEDILQIISFLQSRLIDVGSRIAVPANSGDDEKEMRVSFDPGYVNTIEEWIDTYDSSLPPLTQFILPSGGECSARFHMARSICRRAERCIVALTKTNAVCEHVLKFINRLSDLLFVFARTAASRDNIPEVKYKKS